MMCLLGDELHVLLFCYLKPLLELSFIQGSYEDYNLEDSLSEGSEKQLLRGKGEAKIYRSFGLAGKKNVVEHKQITVYHKNKHLKLMIFFFTYRKTQESGEIIP